MSCIVVCLVSAMHHLVIYGHIYSWFWHDSVETVPLLLIVLAPHHDTKFDKRGQE